jgi:hypothetical protein
MRLLNFKTAAALVVEAIGAKGKSHFTGRIRKITVELK